LYWELRRTVLYPVVDVLAKPRLANAVSDNGRVATTRFGHPFAVGNESGELVQEIWDKPAIFRVQTEYASLLYEDFR
jgi:hypothetical protein